MNGAEIVSSLDTVRLVVFRNAPSGQDQPDLSNTLTTFC